MCGLIVYMRQITNLLPILLFAELLWVLTAGSIPAAPFTTPNYPHPSNTPVSRRDTLPNNGTPGDTGQRVQPTIQTVGLSKLAVCPGTLISVAYTTNGDFRADNGFVVQLVDAENNFINLNEPAKANPLLVTIPANKAPDHRYQIRVVSTSPAVYGSVHPIRILPPPTARVEMPDGGTATTIMPGQSTTLQVALSGAGPWSFVLSDSTQVINTLESPYRLMVAPATPTAYNIIRVSNACATGTATGTVIVNVSENPAPALTLKAPGGGYKVCTGTPFQMAFNATGRYTTGNEFVAQIEGDTGSWTNLPGQAAGSPLTTRLPYGITPGKTYRIRVVSTYPTITSDIAQVTVSTQATAILRPDSIRIEDGKSTDLTIDFSGNGPWFVLLSDGTYENGITKTPHKVRVTPANPTGYSITSAGGACGVGEFRGRAFVQVNVPPSTITTGNLSNRTLCYGSEITVPFTSTGRFYAGNKWIVQAGDSTGRFVSLATTYKDGVLKATINPAFLRDTVNTIRLRVIATSPAVNGTETSLTVLAPNTGQALVMGEAAIRPGQTARVRVQFKNGLPPWSFTLSDGTKVSGTFINPFVLTVAPVTTTEYKITSLSSSCGSGIAQGKAVVTVDTN
ncbi:hypothetical protein GCM10023187_48380 [Nibrella viscosa]|uniref:Ig-like domain-containing protein n=2 Tax=Nibrella viscosa TaxID=1084524 RepID=A0ABP8KUT0_9BACT